MNLKSKTAQQEFPDFPKGRAIMLPDGSEVLDPRPVELPVGFERPETIQEMIRRLVTDPAIRAELEASEAESFDEADDLEIDDGMPVSPHEDQFDPMHLLAREQEIRAGTVKPRSQEEIAKAKAVLEEHAKKSAPKSPPAGEPGKA